MEMLTEIWVEGLSVASVDVPASEYVLEIKEIV